MKYLLFVLFTLNIINSIASQYRLENDNKQKNGDYPADTSDIHYYIWNDLNKRDNFYPNILNNIQNEFQYSVQPIDNNHKAKLSSPAIQSMAYSTNLNPRLPSIPTNQLLTNEMFKPSDSISSIPLFNYVVQQSLVMNQLGQNDRYYRNRNKLNYPYMWNLPIALKSSATNDGGAKRLRPNLREMYNDKNVHTFKYYSNLPKSKRLFDSSDQNRDYSMIKKPTASKEYSTFEMLEPIPQKVILPPVFKRIPEFKPVPPRLTVIPVVSEYLAKYPNQILSYYRPPMPLDALSNDSKHNFGAGHRKVLPNPPIQMIPFSLSDAVTWPSIVHSITTITTTENPRPQLNKDNVFTADKYQNDIISTIGTLDPVDYKKIPIQKIQSNAETMYWNKMNDSSTSETIWNIEQSEKRHNKLSNYKQKLRTYVKSFQKNNTNDMNTINENDIYDIRPVHELVTDEQRLANDQKLQQQQIQKQNPPKIQLSEAYSRQTSNVIRPIYPDEHSINNNYNNQLKMNANMNISDDNNNMIQTTTIQSKQFLIAIPDNDDLQLDESTRSSKIARNDFYSMNFEERNDKIQNTTDTWISLNQTKQPMETIKAEGQNNQIRHNQNQVTTLTTEERYKKWFDNFKEKNRQKGKPIYSEHFRKVEIQPNIQWTTQKNDGHHDEKWSTDGNRRTSEQLSSSTAASSTKSQPDETNTKEKHNS